MNHYSSNLPNWYALTSPKYKVISKASIAASLVATAIQSVLPIEDHQKLHFDGLANLQHCLAQKQSKKMQLRHR